MGGGSGQGGGGSGGGQGRCERRSEVFLKILFFWGGGEGQGRVRCERRSEKYFLGGRVGGYRLGGQGWM